MATIGTNKGGNIATGSGNDTIFALGGAMWFSPSLRFNHEYQYVRNNPSPRANIQVPSA